MRVALISDIHANLPALEAVVRDIHDKDVQQIVCLGDTATVGNQPREVLDLLQDLNCILVMGNHDTAILEPQRATEMHIPVEMLDSLQWSASQLTAGHRDFIASFSKTVLLTLDEDVEVLCFHGSPRRSYALVLPTMEDAELTALFGDTPAGWLAGGHIHQQVYRRVGSKTLVNPGSVGTAWVWNGGPPGPTLMPWAEYAVIEVGTGKAEAQLTRVPYDIDKAERLLGETDNPAKQRWRTQYKSI